MNADADSDVQRVAIPVDGAILACRGNALPTDPGGTDDDRLGLWGAESTSRSLLSAG